MAEPAKLPPLYEEALASLKRLDAESKRAVWDDPAEELAFWTMVTRDIDDMIGAAMRIKGRAVWGFARKSREITTERPATSPRADAVFTRSGSRKRGGCG